MRNEGGTKRRATVTSPGACREAIRAVRLQHTPASGHAPAQGCTAAGWLQPAGRTAAAAGAAAAAAAPAAAGLASRSLTSAEEVYQNWLGLISSCGTTYNGECLVSAFWFFPRARSTAQRSDLPATPSMPSAAQQSATHLCHDAGHAQHGPAAVHALRLGKPLEALGVGAQTQGVKACRQQQRHSGHSMLGTQHGELAGVQGDPRGAASRGCCPPVPPGCQLAHPGARPEGSGHKILHARRTKGSRGPPGAGCACNAAVPPTQRTQHPP